MDILQNITEAAKNKGLTLTEIERACGFSKSSMRKWSENIPSIEKILKVADCLDVSVDSLLRAEKTFAVEQLRADEQRLLGYYSKLSDIDKGVIIGRAEQLAELEAAQAAKNAIKIKPIEEPQDDEEEPLYLDMYDMPVSAGRGACIDYAKAETIQVPRTYETEQANYMVRISGNSMEPRFEDGDVVLVKAVPTVDKGDIGIFVVNGQAYIKELGENELISLNPKYDNIPLLENDSGYCQGKVIGIVDIKK